MHKKATNNKKAFTLIEILVVIVILAVMAAIVIIAINPFRQTANVRNAQRQSDIYAIYSATNQYLIDKSVLPSSIGTTALEICRTNASNCVGMADLSVLNESSRYLVSIPIDPKSTSTNGTGYFIYKTSADRPVVYAGASELGQTIVIGGSVSGGGFVMTNPISRWTFDNGAGCSATDSFNVNNGNLGPICPSNSPVWIAGKVNNALFFDGTDDYVTINDSASLNPTEAITLSAWIKWNINPNTGLSWTSIINKNSDNQYRLQHNSSNTAFEFGLRTTGGSKWVVSNTIPVINVWYFVVATYDKQIMKIYVNGALDNSITYSGSILTSNSAVSIGKRSIINDRFFNGTIDEVSIYSSALSPLEIQNLYTAGN